MARVTIEDCLQKVPNRFALIHLGAARVRQLYKGVPVMLDRVRNKEIVTALREIAAGKVMLAEPEKVLREPPGLLPGEPED